MSFNVVYVSLGVKTNSVQSNFELVSLNQSHIFLIVNVDVYVKISSL